MTCVLSTNGIRVLRLLIKSGTGVGVFAILFEELKNNCDSLVQTMKLYVKICHYLIFFNTEMDLKVMIDWLAVAVGITGHTAIWGEWN